ncbi:hypothetical protein SAMN02745164_01059 [Marinitoga hydrogenitolerans DSM 16785]|uniref:Uncharacterized protein n=1 Tax=Marinitoga hydrogenitolerans (strain DSM 16785 / JCM 12826 / AT1271) TaxID=1122195 RepID=A0A1M4W071_MARH1|nr:HAMP domain-containing histidine kinase [Marinitoga hydrogenitolerans]SHE74606.1 hypothetical protein SAMN02745164_01059 [Marinitoga hydrogenitolerans DSM 16785]
MSKCSKPFIIIYLLIVATFTFFIFLIKADIEKYEKNKEIMKLKTIIFQTDEKLRESIFHYIKYDHFNFKPFKLIIYNNENKVYTDFKDVENTFFYKKIEINNTSYLYGYVLPEYISYLNQFSDLNIILSYNNNLYPKTSIPRKYFSFNFNDMTFYIIPDKRFYMLFFDKLLIFIIINLILFSLLLFFLKRTYYYATNDLRSLSEFITHNNDNKIKLKTKDGIVLKSKLSHILNEFENAEKMLFDFKKELNIVKKKNDTLINDLIFSIYTPLQNLVNSINLDLPNDLKKSSINKNISEINNIIEKFKYIFLFETTITKQSFFEFFDINKFHNELIYSLSLYTKKNHIVVKKETTLKNPIIFSNREKLYKILYEILTLSLDEKEKGSIIIIYSLINNTLEIKIIDKDNIFNDYILLLNTQNIFDKTNIKLYDIALIKKFIKDLNGKLFLNQTESDTIIKIEVPIDCIEFVKNYDFITLKNSYLTKLIEKNYTVNQANNYLNELISIYIKTLKNPTKDNIEKIKYHLEKSDFKMLQNWLEFILLNYEDKKIKIFKELVIKKLGSL